MSNKIKNITTGYSLVMLKKVLNWAKQNPEKKFKLPESVTGNWFGNIFTGESWHAWFIKCLHEKINYKEPSRGRKDDPDWFRSMRFAQRKLQGRCTIHWGELPYELRNRFKHRIYDQLNEE
jgi:hypothetical protein